tara:strand:- start:509 stop:1474 length:966 start_codon:yes stop_codon:yes gene_type:complete
MSLGFKSGLRRLLGRPKDNVVTGTSEPDAALEVLREEAENPVQGRRAEQIRVFEQGRLRLIYETTIRAGKPLVVVFSGVDTHAGRCATSYYGLHWQLDASVVHIHDNFGAHGNYLLQLDKDPTVGWATVKLLRQLMSETGTTPRDLWLVGTSKGATTALCMALMLRAGNCIAAEPQILLGDFFYPDDRDWSVHEELRGLAYAMTGRVNIEDKPALNAIVPTLLRRWLLQYKGKMLVVFGKGTGYYQQHIIHLDNAIKQIQRNAPGKAKDLRVTLRKEPFNRHIDVVPVFLDMLFKQFGILDPDPSIDPDTARPEPAQEKQL